MQSAGDPAAPAAPVGTPSGSPPLEQLVYQLSQQVATLETNTSVFYNKHKSEFAQLSGEMATVQQLLRNLQPSASSTTSGLPTNPAQPFSVRLPPNLKAPTPSTYDGCSRQAFRPWVERTRAILVLSGMALDSQTAVAYTAALFTDKAATWWTSIVQQTKDQFGNFKSFDELIAAYAPQVEDPNRMQLAMRKIKQCKQTGSVLSYSAEFFHLLNQIPHRAPEDALLDYVDGLKPFHYNYVKMKQPKDVHEARDFAHEADDAYLAGKRHSSANNFPSFSNSRSSSSSAPTPMDLNTITTAVSAALTNLSLTNSTRKTDRSASRGRSRTRAPTPGPRSRGSSTDSVYSLTSLTTRPFKRLTDRDRDILRKNNICFFCRKAGHQISACPDRPSNSHRSSRSVSPSRSSGK